MTVGELRAALDGVRDDMVVACMQGIVVGADVFQLGPLTDEHGTVVDQSGAEEEAFFIDIREV